MILDIVDKYQKLLELQVNDLKNSARDGIIKYRIFYFDDYQPSTTFINKNGYVYVLDRGNIEREALEELIRRGLIIKIGRVDGVDVYTTLHADVIFRVLRGRAYEDDLDGRWVGYYKIDVYWEYMPDFNAKSVSDLKPVLIEFFIKNGVEYDLAEALARAIVEGMEDSGIKRIAEWQFKAVETALRHLHGISENRVNRYFVISAPTATGKTLVFQLVALAHVLLYKFTKKTKGSQLEDAKVLILYPRKALQKQQLERLLKPVHYVNVKLREAGLLKEFNVEPVTVAIDKGREREENIEEIDTGIKCPHSASHTIKLKLESSAQNVICTDGTRLDYVVGIVVRGVDRHIIARRKPDILISNPWALRSRLLSPEHVLSELYKARGFVILDEAHVYTNVNYADLVATIRLHYRIREKEGLPTVVIGSSATIPLEDPRELLTWMLGLDKSFVEAIEYTKLEPQHGRRKRMKIVVTLLPYRLSMETTLQGVIQVLLTATSERLFKSLVFVDSISEASTIMGYLETILTKRRAVEICDHLLQIPCRKASGRFISDYRPSISVDPNEYDDYSWSHYIVLNRGKRVEDLLNSLSGLINYVGLHHGALSDYDRKFIESAFASGQKRLLISTSTLDLGMDYDDVTFIVQYKTPTSDEAFEQRIGRAGRKDEAMRIALAFYIPTVTPALLQRIFSREIQEEDTILPDPCIIEQYYLAQALEYELVKIYEDLVRTSLRGDIREMFIRNVNSYIRDVFRYMEFKKRWLPRETSCKEFGSIGGHLQGIAETLTKIGDESIARMRKDLEEVLNKLRQLARVEYASDIARKFADEIMRESDLTKVLKSLDYGKVEQAKKNAINSAMEYVKGAIDGIFQAIKVLESIQDYDYDSDIIKQRLDQGLRRLEETLQLIESNISRPEITLNVLKYKVERTEGRMVVDVLTLTRIIREKLESKLLEHYSSTIKELIDKLREYLSNRASLAIFYEMMNSGKRLEKLWKESCKQCHDLERHLSSCWYYCLREVLYTILGDLKIANLMLKERDKVVLSLVVLD